MFRLKKNVTWHGIILIRNEACTRIWFGSGNIFVYTNRVNRVNNLWFVIDFQHTNLFGERVWLFDAFVFEALNTFDIWQNFTTEINAPLDAQNNKETSTQINIARVTFKKLTPWYDSTTNVYAVSPSRHFCASKIFYLTIEHCTRVRPGIKWFSSWAYDHAVCQRARLGGLRLFGGSDRRPSEAGHARLASVPNAPRNHGQC